MWRRSQLVRKADGTLACPDDARGMDVVTLAEGNAEAQRFRRHGELTRDGAGFSKDAPAAIPNPTTTNRGGSFT